LVIVALFDRISYQSRTHLTTQYEEHSMTFKSNRLTARPGKNKAHHRTIAECLESRVLLSGDINLTGYNLTFADEFNAVSVATSPPKGSATWYHWPPYGAGAGYSSSTWDASAFSASNGILSDKAFKDASGNWHSGNLSSMDTQGNGFAQQYGYFEARVKMPDSGTGSWPAFWLMSQNSIDALNQPTPNLELDIFEWYGSTHNNATGVVQQASHHWNYDGSQETTQNLFSPSTPIPDGTQPWAGYHTYGLQVDAAHVTWYIDGVQTNQIATPTTYLSSPLYIMVDYALGGGWPLSGVVENSHMDVDWVRAYSLPQAPVSTNTTLNPLADSFVKDGTPTTNYGTATGLEVKSSGVGNLRKDYLRFDGSTIPSTSVATSGSLSLQFTAGLAAARTYQLYGINNGSAGEAFGETAITWNNAPGNNADGSFNANATLLGSVNLAAGATSVTFDQSNSSLLSFLNADTNDVLTFAIYKASNSGLDTIKSREAATGQPVLQMVTIEPAPSAPTSLLAAAVSSGQIQLNWTDTSSNELGFKIERATNSAFTQDFVPITTTAANATGFLDTNLLANTTYYYRVRAANASDSANSNTASATTAAMVVGNLNPLADTFIKDGTPTTNFGSQGTLEVKSSGTGSLRKAYLRFNRSAYPAAASAASLSLTFTAGVGGARTYYLYGIANGSTNETFGETALTWNNAPGNNADGSFNASATLLGTVSLVSGATSLAFSSAELTAFINADTNSTLTFAIYKASNTGVDTISSREAATGKPVLQIVTESTTLLSQGKTATASSQLDSSTPPSNAVDGSDTTRWASQPGDNQWLQVNLGAVHTFSEVKVAWGTDYGVSYKIQSSLDGVTWTDVYTTTAGTGGVEDLLGFSATGRYVRLLGLDAATANGYSLWELQVFGS
jgi:beta-glucanase (GH16 family)